MTSEIGRV